MSIMKTKGTIGGRGARSAALVLGFFGLVGMSTPAEAEHVTLPLRCSTGPSGQRFDVKVTMPSRVEAGSVFAVRIDGASSGKISHTGLNYLHDMSVEYVLPSGTAYVDGSAQLVPGTGTTNVRAGARVSYRNGALTLVLPGKVDNGTDFTPPSISLQLKATGSPGSSAAVGFSQYRLKTNAFLIGDVAVSCDPTSKPYAVGTTMITAPGAMASAP